MAKDREQVCEASNWFKEVRSAEEPGNITMVSALNKSNIIAYKYNVM